jgi:predicted N-acetyltransferase YhbS
MTTTAARDEALSIRALGRDDLAGVVAIDAAIEGRPRRDYVERRLAAALREPALHAQFAACDEDGLAGYILARVLEGEFGRTEPALRLELVGVRPGARGQRVGAQLFQVLAGWAKRHGIREIHTTASWRDARMLHWLDTMGFSLAPVFVLDVSVDEAARRPQREQVTLARGHGPAGEVDFGDPQANDDERMAAQRPEVRPMRAEDLREIVRIDRGMTGRDRGGYIEARLAEAMDESGIRVSLAARVGGAIAGYAMARADLGDCGRTEPVAVLDTLGVAVGQWRSGIGRALLEQLFDNLAALRIERAETVVAVDDLALLGFFDHMGFRPSQRLAFTCRLDQAG